MVVGEFTQETDLLVIGGGPGGYAAAFRAADLGVSTVIVDPRERLGGVCLHEGCVPSKTLLHVAETIGRAESAAAFGVRYAAPTIEFQKVKAWLASTIDRLASGLETLRKKHGVELIQGNARFENDKHVAIPGGSVPRIKFRRAIIATGAVAIDHPALPFTPKRVLRSNEALALPSVPDTLLVVGSEYQAIELATIYSGLGSRVTLVTEGDRWMPAADPDLTRGTMRRLTGSLEHAATGVTITKANIDETVSVVYGGSTPPPRDAFDTVVVAIGHRGNTDALQLSHAKVDVNDAGAITVDEQLRTGNPRVFAVGDVTGPPELADKAIHQGKIAAEVIAGWDSLFDARSIPFVAFTDPQIAWCGLTESQAVTQGIDAAVRKIPWAASGRAVGMGRADGLTKIIYDPDTKLVLGVGIAGSSAAEMIAEGCLAIEMGAELADLAATIHPHPTASELLADVAAEADEAP